jgi:cytochrome c-type biogenesis protein
VLGSILVLAGESETVWEGSALLAVYALGLAVPFLIAAAVFVPAMGVFRRVRDHYLAIRFMSGLVMVALGALLFAGEFWRLRVYLNRFFHFLGLEE